jgi:hypothetical protein
LKERGWFDIPVVYNNNRRAILAMEKGTPGERVFADAFEAWKTFGGEARSKFLYLSATNEKMHGIWGRGLEKFSDTRSPWGTRAGRSAARRVNPCFSR